MKLSSFAVGILAGVLITLGINYLRPTPEGVRPPAIAPAKPEQPPIPEPKEAKSKTTLPIQPEELIRKAEEMIGQNQWREGEILLTRAISADSRSLLAWRKLASLHLAVVEVKTKASDVNAAGTALDEAAQAINKIREMSVDPERNDVDPAIVVEHEMAFKNTQKHLGEAVDARCNTEIDKALKCANDAGHWYWKNNRDKVVEGLSHLRVVLQLSRWSGEETRIRGTDALAKLTAKANPEERDALLSRAGFDLTKSEPDTGSQTK